MGRKHYFMGKGGRTRGTDPDNDTNTTIEGVAKTGEVSKLGTVAQTEHWSGQQDVNVRPKPVAIKFLNTKET